MPLPWETKTDILPRRRLKDVSRGDDGTVSAFQVFRNSGGQIQSWQPPHPRPEKFAAVVRGDDGIAAKFIRFALPPVFDPPPIYRWPYTSGGKPGKDPDTGDNGIEGKFTVWKNTGWEVQSVQPNHPRPERAAAIMPREDGIEAIFVPSVITWGYEQPAVHLRRNVSQRYAGTKGKSEFAIFAAFVPDGWEQVSTQPPHPRPERAAAIAPSSFIEGLYIYNAYDAWEVQSWQPPHPHPERRFGALAKGDDGTEATFINWYVEGWEVQPPQPPHPRPERSGAIAPSSFIEGKYVYNSYDAWEVQAWQPPHPRREKAGSIAPWINIDPVYVNWHNFGWEIQPPQPPHPVALKRGALMRGEDGIEYLLQIVFPRGWEVQPWQPPHPRPERSAAIAFGSEVYFIPTRVSQLLRNVILRSRILGLDEQITIQNLVNVIERARILGGPIY